MDAILGSLTHRHDFAGEAREGERRTGWVIGITLGMMVGEIVAGMVYGSMALLAGRSLGWMWMDPAMGIVGALVIARWSWGLLRDTSAVLLDGEVDARRHREIAVAIEAQDGNRVSDLHLWRIGPRHLAAIVSSDVRGARAWAASPGGP